MEFRRLKANEIDCRVSTINENGLALLLYKDARVDQNILDETVGSMNWQRKHTRDNANCIVSIWDSNKCQWIEKEDTGTESFSEAEKGLASDSFKRACFNWGIGRELYTAPFIWVTKDNCKIEKKKGNDGKEKFVCNDKFKVQDIEYNDDKEIIKLVIINRTIGEIVYNYSISKGKAQKVQKQTDSKQETQDDRLELIVRFEKLVLETGTSKELIYDTYKVENNTQMSNAQLEQAIRKMEQNLNGGSKNE